MLIQLPGGSPDRQGPQQAGQESSTFEAGLRRDLASSPVVSYDAMLGGAPKRALDFMLVLLTAPLWAPLMLLAAGIAMLSGRRARVFASAERIGYGGRAFKCYSLSITAATARDEGGVVVANDAIAGFRSRGAVWGAALSRLPQLINVLRGDMALVGPSPLSRQQLEPMKSARRYYLSARPGVVGVSTVVGGGDPNSQYKLYAVSWDLATDALILWEAVRSLLVKAG